ncbi:hypothetical protein K474DRAFT_1406350 [Panus rudis PR-1116 ss-1]|nr:hypothetical protein K474DRAFT_1406350 [Panus rudis PR-1116 ss-1]
MSEHSMSEQFPVSNPCPTRPIPRSLRFVTPATCYTRPFLRVIARSQSKPVRTHSKRVRYSCATRSPIVTPFAIRARPAPRVQPNRPPILCATRFPILFATPAQPVPGSRLVSNPCPTVPRPRSPFPVPRLQLVPDSCRTHSRPFLSSKPVHHHSHPIPEPIPRTHPIPEPIPRTHSPNPFVPHVPHRLIGSYPVLAYHSTLSYHDKTRDRTSVCPFSRPTLSHPRG